jgi:hypothetical protein
MISLDKLHLFKLFLLESSSTKERVIKYASELIQHEAYHEWLSKDQFSLMPFRVPDRLGAEDGNRQLFTDLGLIKEDKLQVRIDEYDGKLQFTDGLWVPGTHRVFSLLDESRLLVEHIRQEGLYNWADSIIDPATGCGRHICAMSHVKNKVALDINIRAVSYSDINRIINDISDVTLCVHDISNELPSAIVHGVDGKVLILVNMPFSLSASESRLPLNADGGETGADLTHKAMRTIKSFVGSKNNVEATRIFILTQQVGDRHEDRWETVETAKRIFWKRQSRI